MGIRGIRQSIPSGYVIGRLSSGSGEPELISIKDLVASSSSTAGGVGSITYVGTGTGLTGGPITAAGTISMANMPTKTVKGNKTGGTAAPTDLTVADIIAMLQIVAPWTPADASGAGLAFSAVSANYTQWGNMAFAYGTFTYPVTADGSAAAISGLPVAAANANYAQVPAVCMVGGKTIANGLVLVPTKNTQNASFSVATPSGAVTNAQLSGATISVMLAYPVA